MNTRAMRPGAGGLQHGDPAQSELCRRLRRPRRYPLPQGRSRPALADHSKVIALDPNDALAYRKRGVIYRVKGDLGRSLPTSTRRSHSIPNIRMATIIAASCIWRRAPDAGDCRLRPGDRAPSGLFQRVVRARCRQPVFRLCRESACRSQAAHELHALQPYTALWLDIVSKRAKLASPLAQAIENVDMTRWPAPWSACSSAS